jgi:hypothetical protein
LSGNDVAVLIEGPARDSRPRDQTEIKGAQHGSE